VSIFLLSALALGCASQQQPDTDQSAATDQWVCPAMVLPTDLAGLAVGFDRSLAPDAFDGLMYGAAVESGMSQVAFAAEASNFTLMEFDDQLAVEGLGLMDVSREADAVTLLYQGIVEPDWERVLMFRKSGDGLVLSRGWVNGEESTPADLAAFYVRHLRMAAAG
jgi:hypothetical protein